MGIVQIASSIGLLKPCCIEALSQAYRATLLLGLPSASSVSFSFTLPCVIVPVLSEHKISMLPKFSIEARRFTMTCLAAMRFAPVEKIDANNCR